MLETRLMNTFIATLIIGRFAIVSIYYYHSYTFFYFYFFNQNTLITIYILIKINTIYL